MLDSRYPEDAEKALATFRPRASQSCAAWAPAQAIRGLGVRRDEGSLDLRLVPPHPAALLVRFAHGPLDRGVVRGGSGNGADGRKTENTVSRFLHASIV